MALIKCHECSEAVSDRARACPKCGAPVIATTKRRRKGYLIQLGISLVFFVVVMFFVWKLVNRLKNDTLAPLKSPTENQTAPR